MTFPSPLPSWFRKLPTIPSKPYPFHSVHSVIWSRMDRMIFRSFRKWNSSQKNTNTVYFEYSYPEIVPKERALSCKQFKVWGTLKKKPLHIFRKECFFYRIFPIGLKEMFSHHTVGSTNTILKKYKITDMIHGYIKRERRH